MYDLEHALGEELSAASFYRRRIEPKQALDKCDFRKDDCALRQFLHEELILEQLRASPAVVSDPAQADLFVVPLPSTFAYQYMRSLESHDCDGCTRLEARLHTFLREQPFWARCSASDHVFLSLRCPGSRRAANRGFDQIFSPSTPGGTRGIHLCLEPASPQQPALAFHTIGVPYAEWDAALLSADAATLERRTSPKSTLLQYSGAPINAVRQAMETAMGRCADCLLRRRRSSRFVVPLRLSRQVRSTRHIR